MSDNPILRPVENGFADVGWTRDGFDVSDGNGLPKSCKSVAQKDVRFANCSEPASFRFSRAALSQFELPSSITEAQRPVEKRFRSQRADRSFQPSPSSALRI